MMFLVRVYITRTDILTACPNGRHGQGCKENCRDNCQDDCEDATGYCIGCEPGWTGYFCEKSNVIIYSLRPILL